MSAQLTTPQVELPVPVLKHPHWRVNFRPGEYREEAIPSLDQCVKLIEATKVSLRGWDFPHLNRGPDGLEYGAHWIACWTQFLDVIEYWRFYQSGQFLHLDALREAVSQEWRTKLEADTRSHLHHCKIDWPQVPGYISIANVIFRITEVLELATRLCEKGTYPSGLEITIELKGVKGHVLTITRDLNRMWSRYCPASMDVIGKTWHFDATVLLTSSAEQSLNIALWFFERFGWTNPSVDVLRRMQVSFLKGQL